MRYALSILLCLLACRAIAQGVHIPAQIDTAHSRVNNTGLHSLILPASHFENRAAVIPVDLYTQHLPFFCRQELKMQQAHVPVTFRLGSMDQCDYLEQKKSHSP